MTKDDHALELRRRALKIALDLSVMDRPDALAVMIWHVP
jgi:hypothetical protein